MTDPITDMFNRIRNAQVVSHPTVVVPFAKIKYEIAEILEKKGFIEKAKIKGRGQRKAIKITLKYNEEKKPYITGLKKISKPGQRIYQGYRDIKRAKGNYGIIIVSTTKGLMTDKETRGQKLGGEVLCEIW